MPQYITALHASSHTTFCNVEIIKYALRLAVAGADYYYYLAVQNKQQPAAAAVVAKKGGLGLRNGARRMEEKKQKQKQKRQRGPAAILRSGQLRS